MKRNKKQYRQSGKRDGLQRSDVSCIYVSVVTSCNEMCFVLYRTLDILLEEITLAAVNHSLSSILAASFDSGAAICPENLILERWRLYNFSKNCLCVV
eukprot:m.177595 g.177595  ORF g.177595 m.177595 type:complete len:98 (-) comp15454_c0_seq13:953-1246(-)